jgi:hypothetical protein
MPKRGYYFISEQTQWLPDMQSLSMSDLLDQLESCEYRCIAGKLELNVAFIELKRRAALEDENRHDLLREDDE